jgi:hypothetical protein
MIKWTCFDFWGSGIVNLLRVSKASFSDEARKFEALG